LLGKGHPRYTFIMSASAYRPHRAWESPLYHAVAEHLATFLANRQVQGRPVPFFIVRDFRAFLDCGVPAHGFLRVHCDDCGHDRIVPFSCKGRGFCPSCCGRRMADTAARLIEETLPEAPVRQWVLTVPYALRILMAYDRDWIATVHHVFLSAVFASLRRRAALSSLGRTAKGGAVTFIQRFGDALNLNVHFHALALDGVYSEDEDGVLLFHPVGSRSDAEVARVLGRVARRINSLLARRTAALDFDAEPDAEDLLPGLYGAAVAGRALDGPRAGQKSARLCSVDGHKPDDDEKGSVHCCATWMVLACMLARRFRRTTGRGSSTCSATCAALRSRLNDWKNCPTGDCCIT
jgi:ribosomal protein S27E